MNNKNYWYDRLIMRLEFRYLHFLLIHLRDGTLRFGLYGIFKVWSSYTDSTPVGLCYILA